MDIKVESVKFDADRKLLDFINEKVGKLDRFFDAIMGAEVTLSLVPGHDNKKAIIRVKVPGNDLIAERACPTFEEAVDDIFREHAKGTTEGGDDKYADTDGDGYSDWNEDRYPSTEEFDYLTDLWKSEGLTGGEYFDKIDSLGLLAPD